MQERAACQWAAWRRGSPASFLPAAAPSTGHTFSSAIRSSIQERQGEKLHLKSGLDDNVSYALPNELSEPKTENFLDLCVTSARRALSLEASLKTTIADTQGNVHSSVMSVGISSDIKVRHS